MTARFVIVRHGNTFTTDEPPRRIGARTDLPLTVSGQEQARALGRLFEEQEWRFDRILSSPLRRTRETAEAIRQAVSTQTQVVLSTLLAEIDHGVDEGRTETEVVARIGDDALNAWETHGHAPPGWQIDGQARIDGWRALFAKHVVGTTLLVTSNGAARFALLAEPSLKAQAARFSTLKLRTGAFGIIRVNGRDLTLVTWDQRP